MKCAVIIFVKFPEAGKVKTRLGKDIGYDTATLLYTAFVEDMLHNMDESGLTPIIAFDSFNLKINTKNGWVIGLLSRSRATI